MYGNHGMMMPPPPNNMQPNQPQPELEGARRNLGSLISGLNSMMGLAYGVTNLVLVGKMFSKLVLKLMLWTAKKALGTAKFAGKPFFYTYKLLFGTGVPSSEFINGKTHRRFPFGGLLLSIGLAAGNIFLLAMRRRRANQLQEIENNLKLSELFEEGKQEVKPVVLSFEEELMEEEMKLNDMRTLFYAKEERLQLADLMKCKLLGDDEESKEIRLDIEAVDPSLVIPPSEEGWNRPIQR